MSFDRPNESSQPPEVEYLIQQFLQERLDATELDCLDALCDEDPEIYDRIFRQFVVDQHLTAVRSTFQIASKLTEQNTVVPTVGRKVPELPSRKEIVRNRWTAAAILTAFAFLAFIVWIEWRNGRADETLTAVATIVDLVDPVWKHPEQALKLGRQLRPGTLSLHSGMIALRFASGTQVILQGPVEFTITDGMRTFCGQGRMSTTVPPSGQGFTIHTPFSSVIDLGTEFYLEVDRNQAEVHVRNGTVEVDRTREKRFSLKKGFSASTHSDGGVRTGPADEKLFVDDAQLKERSYLYRSKLNVERMLRRSRWDDDPSLLIDYHFDNVQGDSVFNRAKANEKAWLIGCRTEKDRFSEEKSVVFRSGTDRIEWAHSGQLDSMTLIMTLRIDENRHPVSRLLLARRFYDEPGYFLWQINCSGEVQFHQHVGGTLRYRTFDAPNVVSWSDRGTWTTLGLVADAKRRTVTHYKDGRLQSSFNWDDPMPIRLDEMTLGNEIPGRRREANRFLDGAVRNFMLFARPLSGDEIAELCVE